MLAVCNGGDIVPDHFIFLHFWTQYNFCSFRLYFALNFYDSIYYSLHCTSIIFRSPCQNEILRSLLKTFKGTIL